MARNPRSIPDYDAVINPIRAARQATSGNQPGAPAKAAQALLKLIACDDPPSPALLGKAPLARRVVGEGALSAQSLLTAKAAASSQCRFGNILQFQFKGLRALDELGLKVFESGEQEVRTFS
jgi:hypothetical protein